MPAVAAIVAALERRYDPSWAESWDAVGLVCGDPAAPVSRVHFAIDPVAAVGDEAIAGGAQLLVTHHPLFLGGTTSVAATTATGRLVHRLVSNGVALFVAHTNADRANPGVSDALGDALGLDQLRPLEPMPAEPLDKLVVFVARADADRVIEAMAAAGAGRIGDYSRCAFMAEGTGTFRPGATASPAIGRPGEIEQVAEARIEMITPARLRREVVAALLAVHPYEEPAYDVYRLETAPANRGLGRVGELAQSTTLAEFTATVAQCLPATVWGVRAAGDPRRPVRTVAVCGGSGGEYAAAAARAGADAFVTSDLKHHATSEAVADLDIGMIDAAHWATEQPWLASAADLLVGDLRESGTTVEPMVSMLVTDPWVRHAPSPPVTP